MDCVLRALTTKQTSKRFSISRRERERKKIEMIIVVLSALINRDMVYISMGIC